MSLMIMDNRQRTCVSHCTFWNNPDTKMAYKQWSLLTQPQYTINSFKSGYSYTLQSIELWFVQAMACSLVGLVASAEPIRFIINMSLMNELKWYMNQ